MSRRHTPVLATGLVGLCLALPAPATADTAGFHHAGSPAEKALDAVIALAERDGDLTQYALGFLSAGKPADKGYSKLVSQALFKAIGEAEKRAVASTCGGVYRSDEVCGLEFVPFTCAQDGPGKPYLYKTVTAAPDRAVIDQRWPEGKTETTRYRLVLQGGRWLVDGIDCGDGTKFNMP